MEISMGNAVPKQQKPKEAEEKTKQRVQKVLHFVSKWWLLEQQNHGHLTLSIFVKSKYLFSIVIVYEHVTIIFGYVLLW